MSLFKIRKKVHQLVGIQGQSDTWRVLSVPARDLLVACVSQLFGLVTRLLPDPLLFHNNGAYPAYTSYPVSRVQPW